MDSTQSGMVGVKLKAGRRACLFTWPTIDTWPPFYILHSPFPLMSSNSRIANNRPTRIINNIHKVLLRACPDLLDCPFPQRPSTHDPGCGRKVPVLRPKQYLAHSVLACHGYYLTLPANFVQCWLACLVALSTLHLQGLRLLGPPRVAG